jgi:hypothetical protein
MKIGIIACDALKDEIEDIIRDEEGIVHKEYVDFGYHLDPTTMRTILLEKVRALEGRVDAVFLGYAVCQSLKGLPDQVQVPTSMIECEDCIEALLGNDQYKCHKRSGGITWFYPSGWAKYGEAGLNHLFKMESVEGEYDPDFILKLMFNGFNRCLFVDSGVGDSTRCLECSQTFAHGLGLVHETARGDLGIIREAYARTKQMAMVSTIPERS